MQRVRSWPRGRPSFPQKIKSDPSGTYLYTSANILHLVIRLRVSLPFLNSCFQKSLDYIFRNAGNRTQVVYALARGKAREVPADCSESLSKIATSFSLLTLQKCIIWRMLPPSFCYPWCPVFFLVPAVFHSSIPLTTMLSSVVVLLAWK